MKIVFFGTPDFAVPSLEILHKNYKVSAVITAPDKERGRGRKVSSTKVKEFAVNNNLMVLQPEKLSDEDFIDELKEIDADLFVIVAFRILPKSVFELPKLGSFNLHGSLLPKYRGAAPIQWALINGDSVTGLTTFFLKEKVDTGNILQQEKVIIEPEDNFGILHDKMSEAGAKLVLNTTSLIAKGNAVEKEQENQEASLAPKITKELCEINWDQSAEKIHNLIRGLSPFPAAFFTRKEQKYKVYRSEVENSLKLSPGEIEQTKNEIFIGCAENALKILELQPEGRKRMTADAFLRGYTII